MLVKPKDCKRALEINFFFFYPVDVKADTRAGLHTRHARFHNVTAHLLLGMSNIAGTRYLCVASGHRVSV
jgi:hypothetical protein